MFTNFRNMATNSFKYTRREAPVKDHETIRVLVKAYTEFIREKSQLFANKNSEYLEWSYIFYNLQA